MHAAGVVSPPPLRKIASVLKFKRLGCPECLLAPPAMPLCCRENMAHIRESSQGQILALACRLKYIHPFELFPVRSAAARLVRFDPPPTTAMPHGRLRACHQKSTCPDVVTLKASYGTDLVMPGGPPSSGNTLDLNKFGSLFIHTSGTKLIYGPY